MDEGHSGVWMNGGDENRFYEIREIDTVGWLLGFVYSIKTRERDESLERGCCLYLWMNRALNCSIP